MKSAPNHPIRPEPTATWATPSLLFRAVRSRRRSRRRRCRDAVVGTLRSAALASKRGVERAFQSLVEGEVTHHAARGADHMVVVAQRGLPPVRSGRGRLHGQVAARTPASSIIARLRYAELWVNAGARCSNSGRVIGDVGIDEHLDDDPAAAVYCWSMWCSRSLTWRWSRSSATMSSSLY